MRPVSFLNYTTYSRINSIWLNKPMNLEQKLYVVIGNFSWRINVRFWKKAIVRTWPSGFKTMILEMLVLNREKYQKFKNKFNMIWFIYEFRHFWYFVLGRKVTMIVVDFHPNKRGSRGKNGVCPSASRRVTENRGAVLNPTACISRTEVQVTSHSPARWPLFCTNADVFSDR